MHAVISGWDEMTQMKKLQFKTKKGRRPKFKTRVDKRTTVDEIATKARELGYKFGKVKP
jgi:hypothetical protein